MNAARPQLAVTLQNAVPLGASKILNLENLTSQADITAESIVLVLLAAGKGTRFGREPKCIQLIYGTPLARHSIDAFRRFVAESVVCVVGYRHEDVAAALGPDNLYVLSDNPAGGTAFAAWEAFSVPAFLEQNPLLVVSMGDRVVPASTFRQLTEAHRSGAREADLTFLTAVYEPPKNRGKGRVVRAQDGRVLRIVEERDILAQPDAPARQAMLDITEGTALYVVRAQTLHRYLGAVTNSNAQAQFYLTDVVEAISRDGGEIRTVTTSVTDPEYDLLCSDVTQPMDLALLEGTLAKAHSLLFPDEMEIEEAAHALAAGRPPAQIASIARQLHQLATLVTSEKLAIAPGRPIGIGVSGGRLRIAFMHPDMGRFFGPAWQMPVGAGTPEGDEQITVLLQAGDDRRIHLFPTNPIYRESTNSLPSDNESMYPDEAISDLHAYEEFGTRMSEGLLLSLGYFSDDELDRRREKGVPLPPPSLWVGNSMRRPFSLVANAIASIRTLRAGNLGAKVQQVLSRGRFGGLHILSTGNIPQGGFSSSSAVTVAMKNAINALWELGIPPDLLVHLACQAEYGTGVRAGSLDQATEQKGRFGQGTLISSNPKDNYRIIGTYPVPAEQFHIVFPYSVERDRTAWRWSWGAYAESIAAGGPLTTGEMRKMTGKAAELAAALVRLPLQTDFFKVIEEDLVADGLLGFENRVWIAGILRQVPLLISVDDLRARLRANSSWYAAQLVETNRLDRNAAQEHADRTMESLFAGWREPLLRRATAEGVVVERGVPLRAMLAYLFGEVAKNFYLIHHPQQWIEYVTRSQAGDRCVDIDPGGMPARETMESELEWERGAAGPDRMNAWLGRFGAAPVDFNRSLDDTSLSDAAPPQFHLLEGGSFFRGLALIDLAEAMLKRAFGSEAVAVRVNAAGQGDFFQVHVDATMADPKDVQRFLRLAFYRRFGLAPSPAFVKLHPGGGAAGVRLSRYDSLPRLVESLRRLA